MVSLKTLRDMGHFDAIWGRQNMGEKNVFFVGGSKIPNSTKLITQGNSSQS